MSKTDWVAVLEEYGATLWRIRKNYNKVRDAARERVIAAINDGISEKKAAELLGVDRMTIRKWLGK